MNRIFLLSPASTTGRRARLLCSSKAAFDLARQVRSRRGAPLGEVFAFLSGLYFRGKLAYARAFARPPQDLTGIFVITPSRGLLDPDVPVRLRDIEEFASVPIELDEPRYRKPFERSARALADQVGAAAQTTPPGPDDARCEVVLLGSIASDKYVSILMAALGDRLRFPGEFVGRGDMSRGGLLLRCVDDAQELTYVPLAGTARHGARPPRLERRPARR